MHQNCFYRAGAEQNQVLTPHAQVPVSAGLRIEGVTVFLSSFFGVSTAHPPLHHLVVQRGGAQGQAGRGWGQPGLVGGVPAVAGGWSLLIFEVPASPNRPRIRLGTE